MTFKETASGMPYKKYNKDKKTVSRKIYFERDVAEEINKIKEVLRLNASIIVNSTVIVDIAMRYFFQMLEDIENEEDAIELLVNGVLLKI